MTDCLFVVTQLVSSAAIIVGATRLHRLRLIGRIVLCRSVEGIIRTASLEVRSAHECKSFRGHGLLSAGAWLHELCFSLSVTSKRSITCLEMRPFDERLHQGIHFGVHRSSCMISVSVVSIAGGLTSERLETPDGHAVAAHLLGVGSTFNRVITIRSLGHESRLVVSHISRLVSAKSKVALLRCPTHRVHLFSAGGALAISLVGTVRKARVVFAHREMRRLQILDHSSHTRVVVRTLVGNGAKLTRLGSSLEGTVLDISEIGAHVAIKSSLALLLGVVISTQGRVVRLVS